jgi:hypothetical protein
VSTPETTPYAWEHSSPYCSPEDPCLDLPAYAYAALEPADSPAGFTDDQLTKVIQHRLQQLLEEQREIQRLRCALQAAEQQLCYAEPVDYLDSASSQDLGWDSASDSLNYMLPCEPEAHSQLRPTRIRIPAQPSTANTGQGSARRHNTPARQPLAAELTTAPTFQALPSPDMHAPCRRSRRRHTPNEPLAKTTAARDRAHTLWHRPPQQRSTHSAARHQPTYGCPAANNTPTPAHSTLETQQPQSPATHSTRRPAVAQPKANSSTGRQLAGNAAIPTTTDSTSTAHLPATGCNTTFAGPPTRARLAAVIPTMQQTHHTAAPQRRSSTARHAATQSLQVTAVPHRYQQNTRVQAATHESQAKVALSNQTDHTAVTPAGHAAAATTSDGTPAVPSRPPDPDACDNTSACAGSNHGTTIATPHPPGERPVILVHTALLALQPNSPASSTCEKSSNTSQVLDMTDPRYWCRWPASGQQTNATAAPASCNMLQATTVASARLNAPYDESTCSLQPAAPALATSARPTGCSSLTASCSAPPECAAATSSVAGGIVFMKPCRRTSMDAADYMAGPAPAPWPPPTAGDSP